MNSLAIIEEGTSKIRLLYPQSWSPSHSWMGLLVAHSITSHGEKRGERRDAPYLNFPDNNLLPFPPSLKKKKFPLITSAIFRSRNRSSLSTHVPVPTRGRTCVNILSSFPSPIGRILCVGKRWLAAFFEHHAWDLHMKGKETGVLSRRAVGNMTLSFWRRDGGYAVVIAGGENFRFFWLTGEGG